MDDGVQTPIAGQQLLAEIRRSDECHKLRWATRGASRRYGLLLLLLLGQKVWLGGAECFVIM